jgi:hypothetical protein
LPASIPIDAAEPIGQPGNHEQVYCGGGIAEGDDVAFLGPDDEPHGCEVVNP